ncbi:MAG TPA: PAS domain S-box protein [Burkholderiales bacterium]|nr:PAS domain S-box protein [Burkholderiales bacterium]
MAGKATPVDPKIYQLMVEQTRDYALFMLDVDGLVTTWNAGANRIKGYTAEEIVGRHFSTFYTREAIDKAWPQYELKVATREGRFEDEGWRLRKDGSRFWASVVITALRDEHGKLLGFSKITRDLTDQRQADEALRQSEERFRLLVEGVVDYAVFMLNPEGVVSSWNPGAARIKGYSRDEIIGRHFSRFYVQEDLDAGKPWEELVIAKRVGRVEDEGWRLRKDGERFWARTVITAMRDHEGTLRGFAKVTQDLTQRRQLQSLERATQNAHEFIATLAHELRNPLAPIRSAVSVMDKLSPDDPAHEEIRQMIDRQSAHLSRIVDDMVDISRISQGALSLDRKPVDLAEVVRRSVEMAMPLVREAKHALEIDLPNDPLFVEGDIYRLTQILSNLINNAARYTPQRGRIFVKARAEEGWVVLSVQDTGRGIEPEMMDHIFQMFVQGGDRSERVGQGLGVGLALARKLAEMHGGTLEGRSEGRGKGSEFALRVPRLKLTARTKEAEVDNQPKAVAMRRVLVVDDNVDAATALHLLLQSLGHESRVEHEGIAALRVVSEFKPDIVLLDLGMPGLDGYEVARRMRQLVTEHPIKIVAVTGWGQEADREKTREAGFDLHLVKPVDLDELSQALNHKNSATVH